MHGLRMERLHTWARAGICAAWSKLRNKKGQGTTEYAILVGVLVVIAILAITVFKPKIQELWDAIAQGVNGL
jgi:Flp pilus assembly pilin Flp